MSLSCLLQSLIFKPSVPVLEELHPLLYVAWLKQNGLSTLQTFVDAFDVPAELDFCL